MKSKIIEIKNEDKYLREVGKQLMGYRIMLDTMALQLGTLSTHFWEKAKKIYPEIIASAWSYNHVDETFQKTIWEDEEPKD